MLRAVMGLGVLLTTASVGVGYDFSKQSEMHPSGGMTLQSYGAQLPQRLTSMAKVNAAKASNAIPQIASTWTGKSWDDMTNDEQIASFTNGDPTLKRVAAASEANARQSFWASVRQKFSSKDKQVGNRLADIKARTAARNYKPTINPSDLSGMSASEIYANRGEISRSFTATAAQSLKAAAGSDF